MAKRKLSRRIADPISKYWRTKADKSWSEVVRKNNKCTVCGSDQNLQAHHMINRHVLKYRHMPLNGLSLCPSCHKFNRKISGHQGPLGLAWVLQTKHPDRWKWLCEQYENWDSNLKPLNYKERYTELMKILDES